MPAPPGQTRSQVPAGNTSAGRDANSRAPGNDEAPGGNQGHSSSNSGSTESTPTIRHEQPTRPRVVYGHVVAETFGAALRVLCPWCTAWHTHRPAAGAFEAPCGKGSYRVALVLGGAT